MRQSDALLPAKLTVAQERNGCFFPCSGDHAEPDPATLNIKDVVGNVALGKGPFFGVEMNNGPAQATGCKECCCIEVALFIEWYVDNR